MTFKKIYLEITNICNLSCDFCLKNTRENSYMSKDNFIKILDKVKKHTRYLYFHLMGEPLIHPNINEFIDIANNYNFYINITTNGYLINKIIDNKNIRQINISLHSFNEKYNITLDEYLENIFNYINKNRDRTYISLRLWVKGKYTSKIIDLLSKKYNIYIDKNLNSSNIILEKNVYLSFSKKFIWPNLNNDCYFKEGNCYALKDHIGILVDGSVVPCCLDSNGIINLGNILNEDLDKILSSNRCKKMVESFKNNKKEEELCKHCKFL